MSDQDPRARERQRRELAQEHRGEVLEGSGRALRPRDMVQMVSVRLDSSLVAELRKIANERSVSMSDLLREGAAFVVATANQTTYNITLERFELLELVGELTPTQSVATNSSGRQVPAA